MGEGMQRIRFSINQASTCSGEEVRRVWILRFESMVMS